MAAKLVFHNKHVYSDGAIAEIKVWEVPKTKRTPEGFKYSLVYIGPNRKRLLGYDNAEGKGHHRHRGEKEESIAFKDIDTVTKVFYEEVQKIRRQAL